MGIRGLETFLRERGLLPSCTNGETKVIEEGTEHKIENRDDFCFQPVEMMPGYTFAIDGYGLVFYIIDVSYKRYFEGIVSKKLKGRNNYGPDSSSYFENEDHFLLHLLPSMMTLSLVESVTNEILESLLMKYKVNLQIYLDGHSKMMCAMNGKEAMKEYTDITRKERRRKQEENLKRFCMHNVLPRSFSEVKKKIPDPELFLKEFPLSKLALDQVLYSIYMFKVTLEAKNKELDCFHSSTTENHGILTIIRCEDEADRSVALASAMDTSNRTFAVGNDSDFFLYGFPKNSPIWIMGDVRVQYVPLKYLLNNMLFNRCLKGLVITRQDIANALQLPAEEYLIESGILLGNDYTKKFVQCSKNSRNKSRHRYHAIESTNLYKEGFLNNYTYKKELDVEDIFHILAQETNNKDGRIYKIQSDDSEFQLAIEYTRDLYQFQNIDRYLYKQQNDDDCEKKDDETQLLKDKWSTIKPLVESMDTEDHSWDTLRHQILAPFSVQLGVESIKVEDNTAGYNELIASALDYIHYNDTKGDILLPTSLLWDQLSLSIQLQKSISIVLRERMTMGAFPHPYLNPSSLFHAVTFQHCIWENQSDEIDGVNLNHICSSQSNRDTFEFGKTYGDRRSKKKSLPIDEYEDDILRNVRENRVTIIQGETGCGKSSRVPLMLLKAPPPDPSSKLTKLFICQPRRIAAKSLFDRMRTSENEFKDQIGLRLGHGVRENETKDTRAWFVTTGYLVKLLANKPEFFDSCTHIIIDEVHERSVDTDILCLLCRRLLSSHPTIRLVLMSATIVADMYREYFCISQPPIFVGTRCHSIQYFYLDDISKHLNLGPREKKLVDEISRDSLKMKNDIPPKSNLVEKLCELAFQVALSVATRGSSVLIFVGGMADIITITEYFESLVTNTIYTCIGIHSDIPFEEQLQAFDSPGKDEIKIIVATNAAESSLTLPDVDHVICLGICKQIFYDSVRHRQVLCPRYISQSSAKQRAGRTGRVRDGYVYRLYPKKMYESMIEFDQGEILRMPLDSIILNLRTIIGDESVTKTLSECLEVPNMINIESSLESLYKLNFIDNPNEFFKITQSGEFVVCLGIDLILGAFIWYAVLFGVTAEAIDIAAIVSIQKSPWLIPNALLQDSETYNRIVTKTFTSKAYFDSNLYSDPFAIMNLIWEWSRSRNQNTFSQRHGIHQARLKHIINTGNSIRTRVASALSINNEKLQLQQSPRDMSIETLTILRLLQVWVFHGSIIKLVDKPNLQHDHLDNDKFTVEITGDKVSDTQLQEILHHENHQYHLENIENIAFNGLFRHDTKSENCLPISQIDFEERLVSMCLERDFSTILYGDGLQLIIYTLESTDAIITPPFDFESSTLVFSTSNNCFGRGWKERDCGAWKCQRTSSYDQEGDKCVRINRLSSIDLSTKKVTKCFKQLKQQISRSCLGNRRSAFCIKLFGDQDRGLCQFQLFTYGQCSYIPTTRILSDLFGISQQKLTLSKVERNLSQKIVFEREPDEEQHVCFMQPSNIPEGARLMYALANGYRSRPVIRLQNNSDETFDESISHIEIVPKGTRLNDRWKQIFSASNKSNVMVDPTSIPVSVLPMKDMDVYACCGNVLELIGGSIRVDCLTLLPPDVTFLSLALRCIGVYLPTKNETTPDYEELLQKADAFRFQLKNRGQELPTLCPTLKTSLCELFDPFVTSEPSDHSLTSELEPFFGIKNDDIDQLEDISFSQTENENHKSTVSINFIEPERYFKEKAVSMKNSDSNTSRDDNLCPKCNRIVLHNGYSSPNIEGNLISNENEHGLEHRLSSIIEKYTLSYMIPCLKEQYECHFCGSIVTNNTDGEEGERLKNNIIENGHLLQYHCILCEAPPMIGRKQIESHIMQSHAKMYHD